MRLCSAMEITLRYRSRDSEEYVSVTGEFLNVPTKEEFIEKLLGNQIRSGRNFCRIGEGVTHSDVMIDITYTVYLKESVILETVTKTLYKDKKMLDISVPSGDVRDVYDNEDFMRAVRKSIFDYFSHQNAVAEEVIRFFLPIR